MLPKITVKLGVALSAVAIALLPVAAAHADPTGNGGLVYDDASAPTVAPDGSTLSADVASLLGSPLAVTGTLAGTQPGDAVAVQRLDRRAGWVTEGMATVGPDGTYAATWRPARPGRTTVRVLPFGEAASAQAAEAAPAREVTVYRPALATWFGPGFYGRRTACGRRMSPRLLGVAHRTLPCGTQVSMFYAGRTITVPVVDRGPFRRGTTWDLTTAAAQALGVTATTTVGALRSSKLGR